MNFSLAPGSLLWIVPVALFAVALAVWAYRFALPPLAPSLKRLLVVLRGVSLVLLALLLARPLLSLAERGGASEVVVLEDRSLSMTLASEEKGKSREQVASRAAADVARRLGGRFRVRRWVFANQTFEATTDSARKLDRAGTALGDAIAAAGELPDLAGVVVVTDGVANRGRDPVQAARELGRPVSAIVVGEAGGWDASVEEVATNPTARVGQPTPMQVRLRHTGDRSRRAKLVVSDGQQVLAQRDVVLAAGGAETIEDLDLVPRRVGLATYRVSVEAGPGEITEANNRRAAVQSVLPDRQRALILSSGPNWDWTWLKRVVEADSSWAVEFAFVRAGRAEALPGRRGGTPSLDGLSRYAAIVAQGVSAADAAGALGSRLGDYARAGGGLALWGADGAGGPSLVALRDTPLGRGLGLALAPGSVAQELEPELPAGEPQEIVRIDDDPETARRLFAGYPPLTGVAPLAERPGDQVLVQGAGVRVPLLLLRRVGRGRVLLVNGSGLWRWAFSGGDAQGKARYQRLWAAALRTLAQPTQSEPLRVSTERPLFAQGEPVPVSASLQDSRFRPVDGAAVEARLEHIGEVEAGSRSSALPAPIRLLGQGAGTYSGRWPPLAPGRYRVEAVARSAGRTLSARSEFVVDAWSPEYQTVDADRRTLERMAQASGGSAATAGQAGDLVRRLASRAASVGRTSEHRLWENSALYVVLLGLLSSEWLLRRRRGLP